ncbi:hypothetical protein J7G27_004049 [Vibrio vulnificus]|nr:hypothetical protein [Vibrio vulnificus]EHU5129729.1 hypothetical protein [Vibrio vulnificus]
MKDVEDNDTNKREVTLATMFKDIEDKFKLLEDRLEKLEHKLQEICERLS